jgi:hypothetical protein
MALIYDQRCSGPRIQGGSVITRIDGVAGGVYLCVRVGPPL